VLMSWLTAVSDQLIIGDRSGIHPQTSLIAAICNKVSVDLDDIPLSIYHRKRFKKIKNLGDQIRQDIDITVNAERIDISVISPVIQDSNDILLGVVRVKSSTGSDHYYAGILC